MKSILTLLLTLVTTLVFSQKECDYDTDVTDSMGIYKSTKEYIMHERYFGNNKTTMLFSLVNADGLISLNVQIVQKDTEFIAAKCFDKNSKIYLQLSNGKIITLIGIDHETCGDFVRNEGDNVRFISNYFLFMKDSYQELKKSPVDLIRIKFSGETQDYIIKPELTSELNNTTYNPSNYFINYLKCIE